MTGLFDSHCHIDATAAGPADPAGEPLRGRLLCGVGPQDWHAVRSAAAVWPGTIPAYGLHPWHVGGAPGDWLSTLERLLVNAPGSWLGEAGLDGLRTAAADPATQEAAFRRQLRLAARLGRPVNLHCVKAWDSFLNLLDADYLADSGARAFIVHSFGGPHQCIKPLAERGAFFTVGPLTARRDSPRARRRIAALPEERLLLESDAFLTPCRDDGAGLEATLSWLAEARGMDITSAARCVADNAGRCFDNERE